MLPKFTEHLLSVKDIRSTRFFQTRIEWNCVKRMDGKSRIGNPIGDIKIPRGYHLFVNQLNCLTSIYDNGKIRLSSSVLKAFIGKEAPECNSAPFVV
ncbi:hypothetical protein CW304_06065 [Bacillus sp. UFRGS-B20]|nr:hypothetical protein CW304_06065 [Bacillus sp. UFRGS-B20]